MLRHSAKLLARSTMPASRSFSAAAVTASDASKGVEFELPTPFKLHGLEEGPAQTAVATREELMGYYTLMYRMRRLEIMCDNEYKARTIRGFCHLYDGQEAVATGLEAALDREDSWITSYRTHCIMLARGGSVKSILGELFGTAKGATSGKGGSMHFYNKKENFYGGQGIVGAQVPVGTGLGFAAKYNHKDDGPMPVSMTVFGDGASNQGQVYESMNMAALWDLPVIYCIENNQYGMGTSTSRSSFNDDYYTIGNKIPGIKCDGMDVLAVRECTKFLKEYCGSGKGPIVVEMNTYRYHGHSMSDPGVTYRNRKEVSKMRATQDPIEFVKKRLLDSELATENEFKDVEKTIRDEVKEAAKKAKAAGFPDDSVAMYDVYADEKGENVYPPFIRFPDFAKSLTDGKPQ